MDKASKQLLRWLEDAESAVADVRRLWGKNAALPIAERDYHGMRMAISLARHKLEVLREDTYDVMAGQAQLTN